MPWKVDSVSEQRSAFVHLVHFVDCPVAEACRRFGISRKTGYKWLRRYRQSPQRRLDDRSRRPVSSPARSAPAVEERVLEIHELFGWGARKVHAFLAQRGVSVPSIRTVHAILRRHGRVQNDPSDPPSRPQFFERSEPNDLWQLDHKGPLEVGRRLRHPLTIIDDHSRYLFPMKLCDDLTFQTVWDHLWNVFGECGLPRSILCDGHFSSRRQLVAPTTFERDLIRLGIDPIHGRPYHPQTQGKVERIHATFARELYPHIDTASVEAFEYDGEQWRTVYNCLRPHESIGDLPPITRWSPSPRQRPPQIPDVEYPEHSSTRVVCHSGRISYRGYQIAAGQGLTGHRVRIEELDEGIAVYYAWKRIRLVPRDQLVKGTRL